MTAPRALVVEDDPMVSLVIQDALEDDGYVTLLTETVVHPDTVQKLQPDVIILDLWLGDGPHGWKWLRTLKSSPGISTIPVIVCTADSRLPAKQTAMIERFSAAIVIKPFDLEAFLHRVHAVTAKAAEGEARPSTWWAPPAACARDRILDAGASLAVSLLPAGHLLLRTDDGEVPLPEARWRQLGWVWEDGLRRAFVRADIDGASWTTSVPVAALPLAGRCTPVTLWRQSPHVPPPLMGCLSFH